MAQQISNEGNKEYTSYPPPTVLPKFTSVNPRPLAPLQSPPTNLSSPELPSAVRDPSFCDQFVLTTHIVPAAFPRVSPHVAQPQSMPDGLSKEERRRFVATTMRSIVEASEKHLKGELGPGSDKVLWICVNRYARKGLRKNSDGFTLFFTPAIGFPKEIWEPTMKSLISTPGGHLIDEMWSWEAVNHGDSSLLNGQNLSAVYDWQDNARDILHFLLYYLPATASSDGLPTALTRLPDLEAQSRTAHGFRQRRFVTVGHSMGGVTSALAAIHVPSLFPCLVLLDPGICQPGTYGIHFGPRLKDYILAAIARKDGWSSREEALKQFSNQPLLRTWHADIVKTYVEHALVKDQKSGVFKLKMPGVQEALTFAHVQVPLEVFEQLANLNPQVELRWVLPGVVPHHYRHVADYEDQMRVRVWRRPKNSSHVALKGAGHLILHEKPDLLAQDLGHFISRKYKQNLPFLAHL